MRWISFAAVVFACARPCAAAGDDRDARRNRVVRVVEKVGPAVVNISTEKVVEVPRFPTLFDDEFFRFGFRPFFHGTRRQKAYSLGSGVVVDARRGLVITNEHVTRRAETITARLGDGRSFRCRVVAVDWGNDLAVLKLIGARDLAEAELQQDDSLYVGETVIAIGNPFGLENTVTTGVVSNKRRTLKRDRGEPFHNLIQTDCAINPGNSGGPLLSVTGRLLGVNTAIRQDAEGIGFAVPAAVVRALLGATFPGEGDFPAFRFGVDANLRVRWVRPADRGNPPDLRVGDVIARAGAADLGGRRDALKAALRGRTRVKLLLRRGTETRTVHLEAAPPAGAPVAFRGMKIAAVTPALAGKYALDVDRGVVVLSVRARSPAARIGVREGDRLLSFGRYQIETLADVRRVKQVADKRGLDVLVYIVRADQRLMGRLPVR